MFEENRIDARICPSDVAEDLPMALEPETAVMYLALIKALDVAEREQGLIIAADTVVVLDGQIIGKPADEAEAFHILSRLRGRSHQVITGVCLVDNGNGAGSGDGGGARAKAIRCLYDVTEVFFSDYSDEELMAYVETDEPYDKAGGYAIQETFGRYVDRIEGDLDNVIGFPMYRILDALEE